MNRQGEFQTRPPKGTLKLTLQQYMNLFKMGEGVRGNTSGGDIIAPSVLGQSELYQIAREHERPKDRFSVRPPHKYTTFSVEKKGDNTRFLVIAAFLKNDDWLLIFQQEKKMLLPNSMKPS